VSNAPSKPVSFSRPKVGYFSNRPRILVLLRDDYLLTPWSRILLEKLTGSQLVKKFSAFYGSRRFTTKLL